jgi:hypothetical protein
LCVGALIVQRNSAKRSGFGLAVRFDEHVAIGRLPKLRERQAGVICWMDCVSSARVFPENGSCRVAIW